MLSVTYALASVQWMATEGEVLVRMTDVTAPIPHPLSWITESDGMGGRRVKICDVKSCEVVPMISAKMEAVFGQACLGVKGVSVEDILSGCQRTWRSEIKSEMRK